MSSCISQALQMNRYEQQWPSGTKGFPRQLLSHPCHMNRETCGTASASFKGCIPEARASLLISHHQSCPPAAPLSSMKHQLLLSHCPQYRHWVEHGLGPRVANSALTLPTALTARRVAQANLKARAKRRLSLSQQ